MPQRKDYVIALLVPWLALNALGITWALQLTGNARGLPEWIPLFVWVALPFGLSHGVGPDGALVLHAALAITFMLVLRLRVSRMTAVGAMMSLLIWVVMTLLGVLSSTFVAISPSWSTMTLGGVARVLPLFPGVLIALVTGTLGLVMSGVLVSCIRGARAAVGGDRP
ncbi:MAG: hypothetical protein LLG08_01415 [Actinomycetia bacterium]|nr:hypothetical protein [Actinomycetes bacterium]